MQPISLAITNYNRFELLLESFKHVLNDDRISEIVISDDASDLDIYKKVIEATKEMPKVKVFRNLTNRDCYSNKMVAVSLTTNDWVILFDSDNILIPDYLNKIYAEKWYEDTILAPSFAKPNFNYSAYSGLIVTKENVSKYIEMPLFTTALNTANYFFNKHTYLKVWDGGFDPINSDTIYQAYNWLKNGNKIKIVPELTYFHKVHNGHYQENIHRSHGIYESVKQKLKQLV